MALRNLLNMCTLQNTIKKLDNKAVANSGFVLLEMTEQKIYTTSSIPHTNDIHCRRYHWSKSCGYTKLKDSIINF